MKVPDIFNFLSVQHYLQEIYQYRRSSENKFSYQIWAEEMGMSDRSYLRQIVMGKRKLNAELAQKIVECLSLSDLEKQYFIILCEYSRAKVGARDEVGRRLVEIIRRRS